MSLDETRDCQLHGRTTFKHRKNQKGEWWSCHLCLKAQWRKAQLKSRENPEVRLYQKDFNKSLYSVKRCLSAYLTMILIAANIKPE